MSINLFALILFFIVSFYREMTFQPFSRNIFCFPIYKQKKTNPLPPPSPPPPPPVVCSTDRSKVVVPVLVLLFVALWFILQGDLLYVFPCVILFLCFSVLLVLRLPRLGERELILVFSYVCSVCACLDLSVSSYSWGLGRAAVCDCGTPWTFLLPFLP